jgi:fumarate hydratase class II
MTAPEPTMPESAAGFRVEHDSMGEVRVPAEAKWRAQTQRAVENFPISGVRLESPHIAALGLIKGAAAAVNVRLGVLDPELGAAIVAAADEVAAGRWDGEFPVDVYQTGSGTSSTMTATAVVAPRATARLGRDVHPNDHVNASQSSNDVFPASLRVAAATSIAGDLRPALGRLADALAAKSAEFADVVTAGRTHLMDATPVTLGQEFGGYAAQVRSAITRLDDTLPRLAQLPIGGTAVGTGVNTPAGFGAAVADELSRRTGLPFVEAPNHFEVQSAQDAVAECSGQLRAAAVALWKICGDLRLMGSGPHTGLAEITLPDLQPGSSIMPGKVNPVLPEAMRMVCAQVIGNDAAITFGCAAGEFELNVTLPMLARNLLESIRLLANASRLLADRCVAGITADVERNRLFAETSPALATSLNPYLGYEEAAKIAKQALAELRPLRDVVVERGHVEAGLISEAQLDEALDALRMTRGPGAGG